MARQKDIRKGGLVLCRKLYSDKDYTYRWIRADHFNHWGILSKMWRWIKSFFRPQWTPVRSEDGLKEMFNDADGMGA